jgi:serine beta-lactamase-like protein LACTB, mitochondrial
MRTPVILAALIGSCIARASQSQAHTGASCRSAIIALADREHNVGLQVAVGRAGRVVYSEGFGFADLEDSVPVTPRTRFTVASVTKAFTGVALLRAAQSGVIDLDASIQRYVPSFPDKPGGAITPRLLAAHLAGIRHWRDERTPELYARHFDDIMEILPLFAGDSLVAPPGTKYSYSSYGYDLLGMALQAAQHKPYQQIVMDEVIAMAGLADTRFDDVRQVIPRRVRHYSYYDLSTFAELEEPVRVPDWDYSHNMAAGDVLTTADDLVRFGDAITHDGMLSAASRALLYTKPRVGAVESPMSFGWYIDSGAGPEPPIHITGSNAGVQAGLYVYPATRVVVAVISNTWGIGSRSGELVGAKPSDLPAQIASQCSGSR